MGRTLEKSNRDCELGLVFLKSWAKPLGPLPPQHGRHTLRLRLCPLPSPVLGAAVDLGKPSGHSVNVCKCERMHVVLRGQGKEIVQTPRSVREKSRSLGAQAVCG